MERLDLEGIVAKRKADLYAPSTTWLKVKNRAYTPTEGRGELFQPERSPRRRPLTAWGLAGTLPCLFQSG